MILRSTGYVDDGKNDSTTVIIAFMTAITRTVRTRTNKIKILWKKKNANWSEHTDTRLFSANRIIKISAVVIGGRKTTDGTRTDGVATAFSRVDSHRRLPRKYIRARTRAHVRRRRRPVRFSRGGPRAGYHTATTRRQRSVHAAWPCHYKKIARYTDGRYRGEPTIFLFFFWMERDDSLDIFVGI